MSELTLQQRYELIQTSDEPYEVKQAALAKLEQQMNPVTHDASILIQESELREGEVE